MDDWGPILPFCITEGKRENMVGKKTFGAEGKSSILWRGPPEGSPELYDMSSGEIKLCRTDIWFRKRLPQRSGPL